MTYETLLVETDDGVTLVRLNRPQALNALNAALLADLVAVLDAVEGDERVGCVVITGSERAFAAGADIKEMADKSYADMFRSDLFAEVSRRFDAFRKPVIAAVAGHALGGGCELAMMCDLIIAADTAKFGQPEINLGIVPGIGGTQRLTRAVGKAKAMDLILTGRTMDAAEAERSGLVARVVAADRLVDEAMEVGRKIAGLSPLAVAMAKELVDAAQDTTLSAGLALERRLFHSLFAFDDQKEGMAAFVAKRKPEFKGR
ncbi:enoyl-CoA hydratase [Phenylobacterium sp.]|jgi:enoyl-CoA hydratase|uniref:enoyl-CoA hydratase n=1 Tax=Phenylobacterium sp. TaxID=1871053 RepID=UPI003783EA27